MGFRLRKSFKMGPVRTTISKSGISASVGVPGARITKKANGNTMTTIDIPGTGISYVKEKSSKSKSKTEVEPKIKISNVNTNFDLKFNSEEKENIMENKDYKIVRRYKNFDYVIDPQTVDAPRPKPESRLSKALNYGIIASTLFARVIEFGIWNILFAWAAATSETSSIASFFALLLVAKLMIAIAVTTISFCVFFTVKNKKIDRARYSYLKFPTNFDKWKEQFVIPFRELLENYQKILTPTQFVAYKKIIKYVEDFDDYFTPSNVNATLTDITITPTTFNELSSLGFLIKPQRGMYVLNTNKILVYKCSEEKIKEKYDNFVRDCENWNIQAQAYNKSLIEKRLKNK